MDKGIKMSSAEAKKEIIKLMKDYSNNKNEDNENNLINKLKENSLINKLKENSFANIIDDNKYKFCWCTLSSYCGYCINRNGYIVVIESDSPIKYTTGLEIELQEGEFTVEENKIIGYKKLNTQNGYIINPDNSNSPYIKIVHREIKLAINEDIYKFMAGAGWLEYDDEDKKYKDEIEKAFETESLEIHHINNNPNDNRIENLVYLPRSIHCKAHKYTNN